ncbi:hypothetical protein CT19431_MP80176 [Cupriavidus taiwanensis]|nr:protein of unknown function [Cupriavidus taiwanensis]SOZ11111.1 protein of unknown function [Cupriavidus taiwanensis]SPC20326.1 hypothetical protein CT19431_MP80176 [Cupriavidus taiwanensis]
MPSQAGARPRPDQVLPVLGSMYFGGRAAAGLRALLPAGRPRLRRGRMSSAVRPYSVISSRILSITPATSFARTSFSLASSASFSARSCLYVAIYIPFLQLGRCMVLEIPVTEHLKKFYKK